MTAADTAPNGTPVDELMVRAENVHKAFGHLEVLKGIDFDVRPGEVSVVVGPSGSGRSTALAVQVRAGQDDSFFPRFGEFMAAFRPDTTSTAPTFADLGVPAALISRAVCLISISPPESTCWSRRESPPIAAPDATPAPPVRAACVRRSVESNR